MNYLLIGFLDSASPIMEGIIDLHNYIFFYLTIVIFFVLWMLVNMIYQFYYHLNFNITTKMIFDRYVLFFGNKVTHGTVIEIIWTVIPSLILIFIAIPSFALLYSMDEIILPGMIIKAIGHQWYWSYEYSNYENINKDIEGKSCNFDSYMLSEKDLEVGQLRLLEVDNPTVLPANIHMRVYVTALDVLHSWAVPALGIKIDAVPGRLSQTALFIKREGVFYGQCSELCGVDHGFMPITIKSVDFNSFYNWTNNK